jgi:hypothetical protein
MARGDHPMRTPVYGVLLIYAALFLFGLGSSVHVRALSIGLYALGIVTAGIGWLMTFRDYSF